MMSEERQYKAYRSAMAEVPEGAACVPHLGVHLFDLTFIEEGNQDMLPDRETLLNFSKWRLLADCVGSLMDIQSRSYHIRYVRQRRTVPRSAEPGKSWPRVTRRCCSRRYFTECARMQHHQHGAQGVLLPL